MGFKYNSANHVSSIILKSLKSKGMEVNEYAKSEIELISLRAYCLHSDQENEHLSNYYNANDPCKIITWNSKADQHEDVYDFLRTSFSIVEEFEHFFAVNRGSGYEVQLRKALGQSLFDISYGNPLGIEMVEKIMMTKSISPKHFPNVYKDDVDNIKIEAFENMVASHVKMQLDYQ